MKSKSPQNKRRLSTPIIIAIISLIGICITTLGVVIVGIFPSLLDIFDSKSNKVETITFRVTEVSGTSVSQAKVILLSGNDIHIQYTDSNGVSTFSLIKAETLRVFVETNQYEIYDQIFSVNTPNPIEIRLNPKDVSKKSVIVRVIDDKDDIPINGAEVVLIANGNIYSQTTDSNGITKFTTAFPVDEIDGDISVNVSGFKAEHQRVTLQADRVQDIRLDKTSGTLIIGFTGEGKEVARTPEIDKETTNQDGGNETANSHSAEENIFDCSSKSLSPEEIINCGTHEYRYTWDVVDAREGVGCYAGEGHSQHHEGVETLSITFSENANQMTLYLNIYTKVKTNVYYNKTIDGTNIWESTITLKENGFEEQNIGSNTFVGFDCMWLNEYTFIE